MITTILEKLADVISIISIAVVVYGTLVAFVKFVAVECRRARRAFSIHALTVLRGDLGTYLLLGLEFLIAADILKTILEPGLMELGVLAGMVLLRTILSFFLNKELKETEREQIAKDAAAPNP
jgi:uncharacterized membrane protein